MSPRVSLSTAYLRLRGLPRPLVASVVALGLFALLLSRSRDELAEAGASLRGADVRWLALAVLCQATALGVIAVNYGRILRRLGHDLGVAPMIRAHLRRYAVSTLVPFGGPASWVVFARDLAPKGVPGSDAVSAVAIYSAASQMAFVLFLIGAGGALALAGGLALSVWTMLLAIPLALVWVGVLVAALSGCGRVTRWRWMPRRIVAFLTRLDEHGITLRDLVVPVALCLVVNLTGLGMLAAALAAVGQEPSLATLVLARLAAQVASHLLPVMQGVGMVELTMTGAMQSLGMHAGAATAGTLLYRTTQFWLPLTLGLLLLVNFGWLGAAARRSLASVPTMGRGWLSGTPRDSRPRFGDRVAARSVSSGSAPVPIPATVPVVTERVRKPGR